MIPKINSAHGSETRNIINELIKLFNQMGYTYDEALQKSHDILNDAKQTNDMNADVQQQIDNVVAGVADPDSEVAQARGSYTVLNGRLTAIDDILQDKAKMHWVDVREYENLKIVVSEGYDWSAAFQAAVDGLPETGGIIYAPYGETYYIENTVTMKDRVKVMGSGIGQTLFKRVQSGAAFEGAGLTNITFRDFSAENTNNGGIFLKFSGGEHLYFDEISIKGMEGTTYTEGISTRECNFVYITNSFFFDTRGHGAVVGTSTLTPKGSCDTVVVDKCFFEGYGTSSTGMGLDISGGIYGDGAFEPVRNVTVTNSVFRNGVRNGLKLQIIEDAIFENNLIEGNGEIGLILNAQDALLKNVSVKGNTIKNNGTALSIMSVNPSASSNVLVELKNNNMSDNTDRCIDIPSEISGEIIIDENTMKNPGVIAVRLDKQTNNSQGTLRLNKNKGDGHTFMVRMPKKVHIKNNEFDAAFRAVYDVDESNTALIEELILEDNDFEGCSDNAIHISRPNIGKLIIKNMDIDDISGRYGVHIDGSNQVINIDILIVNDNRIFDAATASIRLRNTSTNKNQCARNTVDKTITIDEVGFNESENLIL